MHFTKNLILCCDKVTLRRKKTSSSFGRTVLGGYGLHYVGENVLKAFQSNTLISNLWAALEKIDTEDEDKIKPISVFKPTDFCNLSQIMVGSVRFVNHSCFPNCEYEVKDWKNRKCVKLKIFPGYRSGEWINGFLRRFIFWRAE